MLELLRKSVFGKEMKSAEIKNARKVCGIAYHQSVLPLVYSALPKETAKNECSDFEKVYLMQLYSNEQQMYFLQKMTEVFEENGVEYCILKGCTAAQLYHCCDCRVSGDVDILIDETDEKKAENLLSEKLKMTVKPRSKDGHHFLATHPNGGLFEIHVKLYSSAFDNIVLENKFKKTEPYRKIEIKGRFSAYALGLNDNLFFLTAHLIKHFVKEGCGIRQITDLLTYVDRYKSELDFDAYFAALAELRFDVLIKNIFGIGVKFFDLDLPEYNDEFVEEILTDVENGGNFGYSERERKGFFDSFIENRTTMDVHKFRVFMSIKKIVRLMPSVLFPSKAFLTEKGYTYLDKSILLYPIAYLNRVIDVIRVLAKKQRTADDILFNPNENECISNRMKMMERMGVVSRNRK